MPKPVKPVIALLYDFDKTLSPKDMQEYGFIPSVNMRPEEFWAEADALAKKNKMDSVLAYMYLMLDKSRQAKKPVRRRDIVKLGASLELNRGVETWFGRVGRFAHESGLKAEHYVISSGLREIIEGCAIYKKFRDVFACEFFYDENGVACWPKNVVNYTTKTQFLFRINKGVLDLSDDAGLNRYAPEETRPVPFSNMIYIGDGFTDVPCMRLVKTNGGYSVAVYANGKKGVADRLLADGRVNFTAPADYREGGELENTVRDIISRVAATDRLVKKTRLQLANISGSAGAPVV